MIIIFIYDKGKMFQILQNSKYRKKETQDKTKKNLK